MDTRREQARAGLPNLKRNAAWQNVERFFRATLLRTCRYCWALAGAIHSKIWRNFKGRPCDVLC
jgi:hypothetical protein